MKTTQKVVEILNTGKLTRNDELDKDEMHLVTSELMKIWGAGEATVETWYQSGTLRPAMEFLKSFVASRLRIFGKTECHSTVTYVTVYTVTLSKLLFSL